MLPSSFLEQQRTSVTSNSSVNSSLTNDTNDTDTIISSINDTTTPTPHIPSTSCTTTGFCDQYEELIEDINACTPKELLPKNGCRRGKWTLEEENFTERIIEDFSIGILDLKQGTTLRNFLSSILNCDPMRITKKYTGDLSIGKRVFMRANLMTISPEFLEKRKYELQNLKDTWFRALIRAEKERREQFLEKGKLGKMSCFLADPSSSSADGHFNACRIESVLIATDLAHEEIKQTVEWLKKAQSNLTSSNEIIDELNRTIREGNEFLPRLKCKVEAFVNSGQPMNHAQSQLYYQQQQQMQLQPQLQLQRPQREECEEYNDLHLQQSLKPSLSSTNSLTDVESCSTGQSPEDESYLTTTFKSGRSYSSDSQHQYIEELFDQIDPSIGNKYKPNKKHKRQSREYQFSSLPSHEQMEIEKTAGLLMGFSLPIA